MDTGSEVSTIPPSKSKNSKQSKRSLFAANGTEIKTFGEIDIQVDFSLRRNFCFTFIIAETNVPIIGADFLSHFNLTLDLRKKCLIDLNTHLSTKAISAICQQSSVHTITDQIHPMVRELVSTFPAIVKPNFSAKNIKHSVRHHIITNCERPITCRARRLAPDKLKVAKETFEKMMSDGIIRTSNSPWASPLHMVLKSNGTWRPCGDFRLLNNVTVADQYPVRYLQDFTSNLSGRVLFSTLDLNSAYWQVPMDEDSIAKTAITTPFGLFEFLRMPFGLRNAAQTFQRFIDAITRDLDFVYAYIDDILVASTNENEHKEHLKMVFDRLQQNGITINVNKCKLH